MNFQLLIISVVKTKMTALVLGKRYAPCMHEVKFFFAFKMIRNLAHYYLRFKKKQKTESILNKACQNNNNQSLPAEMRCSTRADQFYNRVLY